MNWQHIYPVKDKMQHKLDVLYCDCMPVIDWELKIVTHNSWDMREAQEYINNDRKPPIRLVHMTEPIYNDGSWLPCPFCKSINLRTNYPKKYQWPASITCMDCGATGPVVDPDQFKEAINKWNKRK